MKAILVMFDSLNRRFLPSYGGTGVECPNFQRLAERSATFDNCYAGSMPCMPARRELHTGRYNFLHRSWGPLEPFDDSVPEMLRNAGVYTHLITDHQHYWEDGGATYHNRFDTYEFFRGQEGDRWKGIVPDASQEISAEPHFAIRRQDTINRRYLQDEKDHPQTQVFNAGLEFVDINCNRDNWFVQIETFDPHEPFFSYEKYQKLYAKPYDGPKVDWPDYGPVTENPQTVQYVRDRYFALMTMCDASLGRVLDLMDEKHLWDDTMLIVCTDHGYLLGEHDWWAKMVQPWYDENIHTPLFIWDPRSQVQGERRQALVQTIDFGPTLLDYFSVAATADMEGQSLREVIGKDQAVREAGLFGAFGMHVNVTDGRYVYMRGPDDPVNQTLLEHTLMPTQMRQRFSPQLLANAELIDAMPFTKSAPLLRMPAGRPHMLDPSVLETLLFDLENDPEQKVPLSDPEIELRMINLMLDLMRRNHAPPSQFERLGLPAAGSAKLEHTRTGKITVR
ncbi:sulfatase (plasmid) [Rhizobium leguminosarum bv. trifolii WSM2304]|uniref:Sulfatase n=1 Tax=Rhizobium leguminosarum bv. trifolii (strain WSM2304) TaxID=395492 RepID=A0ABF7QYY0_RHILW|nr:sulfatase [Rhizobium leguminosarum]ACI59483.1 sulfatase [Rhizobium leguminosarum bv. trifolii WSM2304]